MTPKSFVHKSQVQLKSQFLISLEIHPVTDSVETYNKTITCLNPKRTRQERTCSESTTPQNEGDFFSLGLFHGGDQTENQHPSFTR